MIDDAIRALARGEAILLYDFADLLKACSPGNGFRSVEGLYERVGDIPYDKKSSFSLWVNRR